MVTVERLGLVGREVEAWRVGHRPPTCFDEGAELVEHDVDLRRVDRRAAGTLEPQRCGKGPDHGHPLATHQRKHLVVVLEQHHASGGQASGEGVVGGEVDLGPRQRVADREPRDPRRGDLDRCRLQLASGERGGHGCVCHPTVARHLQVQSGTQGSDPVVHAPPVGHDNAVEPPLVPQHLCQQPVVLGRVGSVDLAVGAHHRGGPRAGDDVLEGGQVDLPQRPFVDLGTDRHALGFLVVGREVLDRRTNARRLECGDVSCAERAGRQWVLRVVLEVATAQRRALDVDPGPSTTPTPSARASRPIASPMAAATRGSQLDPTATAGGKQVAGADSCRPRWSSVPTWKRTPCGPSVRTSDGTPT